MKHLISIFTFFAVMLFKLEVSSQIITPQEVLKLNDIKEFAIVSDLLQKKGFEYNMSSGTANEREYSWCFRPVESNPEIIAAFAKKVTVSGNSKMTVTFYNFHLYREFINSLLKLKFRFEGMKTLEKDNLIKGKIESIGYLHFTKKGLAFLTRDAIGFDDTKFYEIILE